MGMCCSLAARANHDRSPWVDVRRERPNMRLKLTARVDCRLRNESFFSAPQLKRDSLGRGRLESASREHMASVLLLFPGILLQLQSTQPQHWKVIATTHFAWLPSSEPYSLILDEPVRPTNDDHWQRLRI